MKLSKPDELTFGSQTGLYAIWQSEARDALDSAADALAHRTGSDPMPRVRAKGTREELSIARVIDLTATAIVAESAVQLAELVDHLTLEVKALKDAAGKG